jgi:hypothetical protein
VNRRRAIALAVALLSLTPGRIWAGMIAQCADPAMFSESDITVIVFPFEDHTSEESVPDESPVGTELAGLIQVDTLLAISRFGSVAAIRMLGSRFECEPQNVLADLMGRFGDGPRERAVVLVTGRIFRAGAETYVQTSASFQRFVRDDPGEILELPLGDRLLAARLATQSLAFAPRLVSDADLRLVRERFARQNVVHERPDEASPGAPLLAVDGATGDAGLRFPAERPAYYVTDVEGDWIHIRVFNGQQGWMLAHALLGEQALSARLPEMRFVEGVAGYFGFRARPTAEKAESAIAALRGFEDSPLSSTTPDAMAVAKQLRGLIQLLAEGQSPAAYERAAPLFAEAAAADPASSAVSNMAAAVALYRDWRQPGRTIGFEEAVDRFWSSVSANPHDVMPLANCWQMFAVARNPAFRGRFSFAPHFTEAELARDQHDMEQVRVGGEPVRLEHTVPVVRWPAAP